MKHVYQELSDTAESLERLLEGLPEARRDSEALLRVELANLTAKLRRILEALCADEREEK